MAGEAEVEEIADDIAESLIADKKFKKYVSSDEAQRRSRLTPAGRWAVSRNKNEKANIKEALKLLKEMPKQQFIEYVNKALTARLNLLSGRNYLIQEVNGKNRVVIISDKEQAAHVNVRWQGGLYQAVQIKEKKNGLIDSIDPERMSRAHITAPVLVERFGARKGMATAALDKALFEGVYDLQIKNFENAVGTADPMIIGRYLHDTIPEKEEAGAEDILGSIDMLDDAAVMVKVDSPKDSDRLQVKLARKLADYGPFSKFNKAYPGLFSALKKIKSNDFKNLYSELDTAEKENDKVKIDHKAEEILEKIKSDSGLNSILYGKNGLFLLLDAREGDIKTFENNIGSKTGRIGIVTNLGAFGLTPNLTVVKRIVAVDLCEEAYEQNEIQFSCRAGRDSVGYFISHVPQGALF